MSGILEVENITKKYGDTEVLKNISFSLNKGETLCIIGPSGSGKSTLLRCINNLEKVDSGTIKICDEYLVENGKYSSKEVVNGINTKTGMVFQDFNLFPHFSVLKNITFSLQKVLKKDKIEAENIAREVLKRVGLSDKEDMYPCNLSGGQKQRVAIARCLAMNEEIISFDEPTSALDIELVGEVLKVINELSNENKTMIIVTHEIEFARNIADKIIFMDNGEIVEAGDRVITTPKMKRTKEFLSRYRYNRKEDTMEIEELTKKDIFKYFSIISSIPRMPKHENRIRDYIVEFAKKRGLKYYTDEYFNIIVTKPSDEGLNKRPPVAFQSHLDMVCEKNEDTKHNFLIDPIELVVDSKYIRANGTTLGADNGAGVSLMLALLDSNIKTGEIECIFTTQEETTMDGVKNIDVDKIKSKKIISLDSGKEANIVISSANCMEWRGVVTSEKENINLDNNYVYELKYSNFKGGHSGGNIADKTRLNPIILAFKVLDSIKDITDIISIKSSGAVNVIPRDICIRLSIDKERLDIEKIEKIIEDERKMCSSDEEKITFERIKDIESITGIGKNSTNRLISFVNNFRNGVIINNTLSANLGSINGNEDGDIVIEYSLRSNNLEERDKYLKELNENVEKNDINIIWSQELYGFNEDKDSRLVREVSRIIKEKTGKDAKLEITQGVLEGGFFSNRIKDLEYIAIGPDTFDVHSPKERLSIKSFETTFDIIKEIAKTDFTI